jgi:hypothetical protein
MTNTSALDPRFIELMTLMQTQSAQIASYLRGFTQQRPWMLPPTGDGDDEWDGDPTKHEELAKAFDKAASREAHAEALHKGTSGGCAAYMSQIAYMEMMERSFRARHRTTCRSIAQAAGRRAGHGNEGGIHVGGVMQYIQDLLVNSAGLTQV